MEGISFAPYHVPEKDWSGTACWVPDGLQGLEITLPNDKGKVYEIPLHVWKASLVNKKRGMRFVSVVRLVPKNDNPNIDSDDPMEVTDHWTQVVPENNVSSSSSPFTSQEEAKVSSSPPHPLPPSVYHIYSPKDVQRAMNGQISLEELEWNLWLYSQLLSELTLLPNASEALSLLAHYSSILDSLDVLICTRLMLVCHIIPRMLIFTAQREEAWTVGMNDHGLPLVLRKYLETEYLLCSALGNRLLQQPVGNEILIPLLENLGITRIPYGFKVPQLSLLEAGCDPIQDRVSSNVLVSKILPALHVREIKNQILQKGIAFLATPGATQGEENRLCLLFNELATALINAFSEAPESYFRDLQLVSLPGVPLARPQHLEWKQKKFKKVRTETKEWNGPWKAPYDFNERKQLSQACGLPDLEDLFAVSPPCMRAVFHKANTKGHLKMDERWAMSQWLVFFAPNAKPDALLSYASLGRPSAFADSDHRTSLLSAFRNQQNVYFDRKPLNGNGKKVVLTVPYTCGMIIKHVPSEGSVLRCPYATKDISSYHTDEKKNNEYINDCRARCSAEQGHVLYNPTDSWLFHYHQRQQEEEEKQ
jgi:hypothetical protein